MNDQVEDLSVSMPDGFAGTAVVEEPGRPGVRISELRHGRGQMANGRVQEPGLVKWFAIGMVGLVAGAALIGVMGWMGVMVCIGLTTVGLLVGIFCRMKR